MEELFPSPLHSLSVAAQIIGAEIVKTEKGILLSTKIDWNEYGNSLNYLHARLMQLNTVLHIEYTFDKGLSDDIMNYTKLVEDAGAECVELVEYLLCRDQIFPGDSYTKYEVLFLKEVLNGISENSERIRSLISV